MTVDLNSPTGLLLRRRRLSGPPWYTPSDWQAAKRSVARLAELEPRVLVPGHGRPLLGPDTALRLRDFSDRFCPRLEPGHG